MSNIRVRIAPSPTGKFQIGNARTALFNYLFAKKNGGVFIVRMEDTDQSRSTKESEENILKSLDFLGLSWDEGPIMGEDGYKGGFGPYRQMERLNTYPEYIDKLINEGGAYRCFCTTEELEEERNKQKEKGIAAPKYSGKCRNLTKAEIEEKIKTGLSYTVRLKIKPEKIKFNDLIKGALEIDMSNYGDPVLVRSDGMPLYNFVVVIDDLLMKITHVIRGEDHISNTPIQIQIHEALGNTPPEFGHIPLTLTPDKKKLSKRHGAVSIDKYKEMGYLKEALINFLVLLGWSSGNEQEIYSLEELIEVFDLSRMQKSNAIFDIERLNWLNGVWIRKKDIQEIVDLSKPYFEKMNVKFDQDYLSKIIILIRDRLKYLSQIPELTDYFFNEGKLDKEKLVFKKSTAEATKKGLEAAENKLSAQDKWPNDVEDFNKLLAEVVSENSLLNGDVFWPIRYSLSFSEASPSPAELLWALPKDVSISRIKTAIDTL
ncbi:MAG: Glutamate-tRNA ligase [candidate division CPR2 bacterium GW2011_GWC2_39_10]|uniref:Glutamate--tRNA ligase n=1 Tax=candidate division CPR2 bacterium GW2011_GWC2_39_10 TaxID=1618345 RepID=A0A0G0M343_UNCC2|nr:MAG: Glutamate-tRNA ligase [candidate division CPR2 bacterium GW2011_GWC2_39_10]